VVTHTQATLAAITESARHLGLDMIDAIPRNCLGKIDRKSLLAKICESKGKDADWFACV
jgi:hypothetical protein